MLDNYVPREEPSGGLTEDYVTRSEVELLMEDIIKTAVEVTKRRVVTVVLEESI